MSVWNGFQFAIGRTLGEILMAMVFIAAAILFLMVLGAFKKD